MPLGAPSRLLARLPGKLALAVLSIAVTVGAFEGGLRLLGFSPLFDVYSKESLFWQYDPLLGWFHRPQTTGRFVGPLPWPIEFDTEVRINSIGLRGPDVGPKPADGHRVLVLGDSIVVGFEVEEHETLVGVAQAELRRAHDFPIEVLNGGVRGYGTDQSLLYYRDRGHLLEADLVVLLFSFNDLRNNVTLHRVARRFGKGAFRMDRSGALELMATPVPEYPICSGVAMTDGFEIIRHDRAIHRIFCGLETRLSDHSALFSWALVGLQRSPGLVEFLHGLTGQHAALHGRSRIARSSVLPPLRSGSAAQIAGPRVRARLAAALVAELAAEVTRHGARFLFVISPAELAQMDADDLEARGVEPVVLEVDSSLPAQQLRYSNDPHYNRFGHRAAGQFLGRAIGRILRRGSDLHG